MGLPEQEAVQSLMYILSLHQASNIQNLEIRWLRKQDDDEHAYGGVNGQCEVLELSSPGGKVSRRKNTICFVSATQSYIMGNQRLWSPPEPLNNDYSWLRSFFPNAFPETTSAQICQVSHLDVQFRHYDFDGSGTLDLEENGQAVTWHELCKSSIPLKFFEMPLA